MKILKKMEEANSQTTHTCDICETVLKTKGYLRKHFDTVHSSKVFICDICSNTFNRKKIPKGFGQKFASNRLQTLFKIQVGSQITRLRAIGKPNHCAKGNWEDKSPG